jgi:alkylated DNA repair dioxygenase AlkB
MEHLIDRDGIALIDNQWLDLNQAQEFFSALVKQISWQQEKISLFGKNIKCPRLTSFYADANIKYSYSGITHVGRQWIGPLVALRALLYERLNISFNSVLCNFYRDGQDYIGWHSDNEKEVRDGAIAAISLGASRKFQFRHKNDKSLVNITLAGGGLLLMTGKLQQYWEHRLPVDKSIILPRISLTFRQISI